MFCSHVRTRSATFFGLLLGLAFGSIDKSWAAAFQVSPTQVFLSAKSPSALLALRNESGGTLRFQLSLFKWDQNPKGELLLSPTEDIVFFPLLVTLAPGEERKIRVGATAPATASEKTYRIFVEEIPSLAKKPDGSEEGGQVQLLTRMGIPIFLQPDQRVARGGVQDTAVGGGLLSFAVHNAGNVHFVVEKVTVKGYGIRGEELFERELSGWYILAGGLRAYELELPKKSCAQAKALEVNVQAGRQSFKDRIEFASGGCRE